MRMQTMYPKNVYLKSTFASGGAKESEGPLAKYFDALYTDDLLGEDNWEKAECDLIKNTVSGALTSAKMTSEDADLIFGGDLLNQCIASSIGAKCFDIPFLGLYGACSTFAEGLCLGSMAVSGGFAKNCLAVSSSHFCSSQKQYRFPLDYGEVRCPTSQWTVTGAGCAVISDQPSAIKITAFTPGKIVDLNVCDANNMGAAMAPAALDTLCTHLKNTGTTPRDYDCIVTGDLANVGSDILKDMLREKGYAADDKHMDCGSMIYDIKNQNVNAGGSGCGCVASVFSGYFAKKLIKNEISKMLLTGTGALMSPSSLLIGESIAGIAHCIQIERV